MMCLMDVWVTVVLPVTVLATACGGGSSPVGVNAGRVAPTTLRVAPAQSASPRWIFLSISKTRIPATTGTFALPGVVSNPQMRPLRQPRGSCWHDWSLSRLGYAECWPPVSRTARYR